MKRYCVIIALLLFCSIATAQPNCVPVGSLDEEDLAFTAGERMDFLIHYKWGIINSDVGVATVILDTVSVGNTPAFHCSVNGNTVWPYNRIFPIKEDFQSWFSRKGLTPLRFYRDTHECSYVSRNDYSYLWSLEEPYIDARVYNTIADSTKILRIPLKPCTFDLPSLFFFARNMDMSRVKIDVRYPMTFAIDDEVYDVYFIFRGKCTKKVPGLGTIRCMRFQAKLLDGQVFNGEHDMDIFISDDKNRLPVLFGAPILVGEAEGRMTSCSGLKYPFSAKIK